MNVLVTGGGGFLGGRIVEMLLARGDDVCVLGRGRYPRLERAGVSTIQADIRDAPAVRNACRDRDIVFHVAGLTGIWGKREAFRSVNVDGTRNVLEGCGHQGVRHLVFTSSPSVVFGKDSVCGVDESQPYASRYVAVYPQTKAIAERLVLNANCSRLATVAIRPHLIWGPGDPHLLPRILARARAGQLRRVGDGRNLVDITYIDNAAEAHLLAAEALAASGDCAGRAYFISQGEPVELWPWFDTILEAVGLPRVTTSISFAAAYRIGAALEWLHRLAFLSREPRMTRFLATQLAKDHHFNIGAARRDLGYSPRVSTSEGVDRLVEYLRKGERSGGVLNGAVG